MLRSDFCYSLKNYKKKLDLNLLGDAMQDRHCSPAVSRDLAINIQAVWLESLGLSEHRGCRTYSYFKMVRVEKLN